jgi:type VI secretion system secreted protein VgrG
MAISSSASASAFSFTQANRPLQLETVLGPDVLILNGFTGEEGVSTPFAFTLELASTNAAIDPAAVVHTPVVISVYTPDNEKRVLHGLVRRFSQLGRTEAGIITYRAEVVPWLWFLSLSSDCRIFQGMNAIEIAQQVFKDLGYADYKISCLQTPPKREYCVQYRETHLDFVSRLFEEEGIFYFFEHSEQKHVLVLADNKSAVVAAGVSPAARWMSVGDGAWPSTDAVRNFESELVAGSKTVTMTDYDFVNPSLGLRRSVDGGGKEQKGEVYDYPAGATDPDGVERYIRLRLEAVESMLHVVRGESNCRGFQSGAKFDLEDHYRPDANQAYHLLRVRHRARIGSLAGGGGGEPTFSYSNEFEAIPSHITYRPPAVTPKPRVYGTQTAVVVGPGGEEIYVDKHARVKVQFHWDRVGKKDEGSSCWVRVSSAWAGKGWGAIEIPRIGQEVVVDFLEGDPDRPLITGRVYNGEQVPPYGLPANMTQSGMKSRSSKGGGDANFNEIRFEDKKGDEELFIHAEKDELHEVENDRTDKVGHDETRSVGNDQSVDVGHDQSVDVKNDQTIDVGGERGLTVAKDETVAIEGSRTETVGKDESITISGARTENVGKDETIDIKNNRTTTVGKVETLTVQDARSVDVAKDDKLTVGKKLIVVATDEISFTSGEASITLKSDGTITISGKDVSVNGSGAIKLTADSDISMKGQSVKQN